MACASGTAALHVALRLAGAGPGTLVGVSDFTFVASANAIAYTGAQPWLIDSEPSSWCLDAGRLHNAVCERARLGRPLPAVIEVVEVVDVLGVPADLEPLLDLRSRFDIPLVEDAAEALGATYRSGWLTGGQAKVPGRGYVHDDVGYNYRLTNLAAALGVAQLERLDEFLAAKRAIAARYDQALAGLPLTLAPRWRDVQPSWWLYSVLLGPGAPPVDAVIDAMATRGVQARRLWPPLHAQAPYRAAARLGGAVADDLYAHGLSLPSSVDLTPATRSGWSTR